MPHTPNWFQGHHKSTSFSLCCSGRCFKRLKISSDLYNYWFQPPLSRRHYLSRFFDSGIAGDRVSFSSMRKVAEAFGNEFPQFNDQDRLKRTIGGPSCLAEWVGDYWEVMRIPPNIPGVPRLEENLMSMEGGSRKPGSGSLFVVFIFI